MEVPANNIIRTCLLNSLDPENFAKFQQVLEYLGDDYYIPLYMSYNEHLLRQLQIVSSHASQFPPDYSLQNHISLKVKFFSFKFIKNVGKFIREKSECNDKSDANFLTLLKILLFHALTSKSITANLALVELEQLCTERQITLQSLYHKYRAKFLRLIIKAVLHKLMTCSENDSTNGNGTIGINRPSNRAITYMTRALEVFNIATITSDDVAKSLIITTNLIHKEKYNDAIRQFLNYLAIYQNIELCTLIRSHIQAIVVSLLIKRKLSTYDMTASLSKLCSFCDKTPSELLATKFTFIKARLLLNYHNNPKSVTESIYYLTKFELQEHEQPFEDEFDEEKHFIDYLNPSMVGILLGVDSYFTSNRKELGSKESIEQIRGLGKLLSLLNEAQVRIIHVKLLSTLSLLLRLRPTRNNQSLNKILIHLWTVFLSKLGKDLKNSLAINICVALYDLVEDCPEDVAEIYYDLLCKRNSQTLIGGLKSLFFIPDTPAMNRIYTYLTPYVRRENSVSNLQELQKSLDCVLPLIKFENQRCRSIALNKIKELLHTNQKLITSNMLKNLDEPLDELLSKTIESLISLSCTQDPECSALIAECLGILGAVNPIRMDHLIYGEISCTNFVGATQLSDPTFVVDLIERLKNSLFSDQKSESETANYALQVVVEKFSVFSDQRIARRLSEEATRACVICKNTSYSGIKKVQPDLSLSVFEKSKLDSQYSYKEWLDKFALSIISVIKDKRAQEVLFACSYIFKYNIKLAEHLLSHAIIHIILQQQTQINIISREFMAIVEEDVGLSTQDLDTVYTEEVGGNIQTLHFQCANMVFCALDLIHRLSIESRKKEPKVVISPRQADYMKEFVNTIPKDKLALLASKCRSHARALCYLDQHLFDNKNQLDKYATALQKIYVGLDDAFEAAGIEVVRASPTTIYDDIANYEACGRFDKAFVCYDTLLQTRNGDIENDSFIDDALRCLSNQGDYQRLYEKSKQLISEHSNQKRNILPYAVDATSNLGKWDELDNVFRNEQMDGLLESSSVSQGYLLMSLNRSSKSAQDSLKIVRHRLMKPLSIAMMDRSAYFRGYQNFLVLHSIGDFSLTLDTFGSEHMDPDLLDENTIESMRLAYDRKMESLLNIWGKRNKLVQPSLRSLEPLLVWQRSISLVLAKKYPCLEERINVDIGQMWLKSADSAREARSFDRSFFCLTQAQRWFGSKFDKLNLDLRVKYHIEQAKLDWDQGEQTRAIRGLKLSIDRLRDHGLYKHLEARGKNPSNEAFPKLDSKESCAECQRCNQSDRESFAKLKMLLTQYSEEAAAGIPETLFFMYEECVHLGVNQEETYLRLARYYDKLLAYYMENPTLCGEQINEEKNQYETTQIFSQNLMNGDKEDVYTMLMQQSIVAFGNSLKYGVRYIRESMPRLLNIWYDLGTKKSRGLNQAPRVISSRIEQTIRFIDELKSSLPPYYFMTAISILLSRVAHPHSGVSKKTCDIMELLLVNYPHQITWHLLALVNDSENDDRKRAAKIILSTCKKRNLSKIEKIVRDTLEFSKVIYELCYGPLNKKGEKTKLASAAHMKDVCPSAMKFDFSRCTVMVPTQASMRAIIPIDNSCGSPENHSAFPEQNVSYITGFNTTLRVFNSLQQPKCVTFNCNNGRNVNIICKSGDDLRKDSRCTEFLDLLNRILRRDNQSNARFFEIQTFLVLPIESHAGIIEMVPNLDTMRHIHETLYKERRVNFSMHDQFPKKVREYSSAKELHTAFLKQVLPKVKPPVLPTWFLRTFTEPTSWYMARLAFVRTAAVSSMGGYIIGLGDRHLDNILINTSNGRLVHVDFNLLFHQGESLPTPETVPFRLTHNFVAAMGPMGTEGNFRKVCEIAMRVMRKEKDSILTTLKPFMHDPCSEWIKVRDMKERGKMSDQEDKHENKSAKIRIEVVERKLKGFPRSRKFKPLTLIDSYSVEAQVDNLIEEAMDTFNLAHMYFGWCPHI